jgi:hypothetical protein
VRIVAADLEPAHQVAYNNPAQARFRYGAKLEIVPRQIDLFGMPFLAFRQRTPAAQVGGICARRPLAG